MLTAADHQINLERRGIITSVRISNRASLLLICF